MRRPRIPWVRSYIEGVVLVGSLSGPVTAQAPAPYPIEQVSYWNGQDSTVLTASLMLPATGGPHPGVVVLSMAWTEPLVEDLVGNGYAVLTPVLRGFVDVGPLLAATFSDLAGDVRAALEYLGSRAEVAPDALGLIAQAGNTPPAMLSMTSAERPVPLVLLAPPAFSGVETFRAEQRWLAERLGAGTGDLEALDQYVARIAEIVLGENAPYMREFRLESVRAGSSVQLPRTNAEFPADERQMQFFASPFWRDRLAFEPELVLARLRSPVLVLIGASEPYTPIEPYLVALRRGLAAAGTDDAAVCLTPGRTRHTFTNEVVRVISRWLADRVATSGAPIVTGSGGLAGCLSDAGP